MACGQRQRPRVLACLHDRSCRPHRPPDSDAASCGTADPSRTQRHRLGTAVDRRPGRGRPLHRPRGPRPSRRVAPAAGRCASRSCATSGHARGICCTWTPNATHGSTVPATPSPGTAPKLAGASGRVQYAHAIIDDHTRLAYVELHADERAATVTGFVVRALAWFAAHGIDPQTTHDRQRLRLHQEPTPRRAAGRQPDPAPDDPPVPPANQREGRAVPPNHGPRMGLRHDLPHRPPPRHEHCHTGCATTTSGAPTAPSAANSPISRVRNLPGHDT